jgi:hypothetical protein
MAIGGLVMMVAALVAALTSTGPVEPWLVRFYVVWCVGVPYWWFLEYRFIIHPLPNSPEREALVYMQGLSRNVWLGFAIAFGVLILFRSG